MTHALWPLDPSSYDRHPLHRDERVWPESNCDIDLWIELLHAAGFEPLAALPIALTVDFEGDQWTFVKMDRADLRRLFGIEVIELTIWRQLLAHVEEQIALGRAVLPEVDAYYLPDTAGTSYRAEHVKTSIGIQAIDADAKRLGYFHNAGYYDLEGDDFEGVLRVGADAASLPPYVEVAKLGSHPPLTGRALVEAAAALLDDCVARRPQSNPFRRYAPRLAEDLGSLAGASIEEFHRYAFAGIRQAGAAFELAAASLRWLDRHAAGSADRMAAAAACDTIASSAKALQFKAARVAHTRRAFDASPLVGSMADAWDAAMDALTGRSAAAQRG